MDFNTSLVREKFIIENKKTPGKDPVVALSNRVALNLISKSGDVREHYVIRTQNMHSCVRLSALIAKEFFDRGPLSIRFSEKKWQDLWHEVTKGYEQEWNPNIWGCVYHDGKIMFSTGDHHPFFDVIEKCDIKNEGEYTDSIRFAEDAFQQAGRHVEIEYDSNIALVVYITDVEAKSGVILRSANRTTTFNFTIKPKSNEKPIQISQCLTLGAAFLEGIQLAFQVGLYNRKKDLGLIEKFSDDDKKGQRSTERMTALGRAIDQFENMFHITYRPERPLFPKAVREAEDIASKILAPQIREMMESGALDDEWIE